MAAGVACGLQNRLEARIAPLVGSTPTRSRHLRARAMWLLLVLSLPSSASRDLWAQEPEVRDSLPVATPEDSVSQQAAGPAGEFAPTVAGLQTGAGLDPVQGEPPVSPMGAFVRSLVIPGWGQAAVEQPVRGAFYFTMEAGSLWMLLKTQSKLDAARRAGNEALIEKRENQKEDWIVLAVFWALFSGVDAWVSAHLWDFEGAVVPPPDGSPGVAVQYTVPVGLP